MSALSLEDFPTIDPWWDLYLPATFQEPDAVLDAFEAAEAATPLPARGDLYAVAARAFAVLGRSVEAERLSEQAMRLGGREADALATFLAPDGMERAERRIADAGRPGARADAACDLAALHLQKGDVVGARAAVERAETLCPGHAEAGRWARFLDDTPDVAAAVRDAVDPRRRRRQSAARHGTAPRDAVDLLPTRRTGWLSVERYQRRLLGTPPEGTWAPSGTALGRLQDAGVATCFFALDVEYARLPAAHPYVPLELAADTLRARVDEGRDAVWDAAALWDALARVDTETRADGAQLLAGLGTLDARLARTASGAVEWLRANRPDRADLWEGYLAWLEHLAGLGGATENGVPRARALATARPVDPLAWRMAIETLRAEGRRDEADRLARAARSEPRLAAVAFELLDAGHTPVRMFVSGRMAPRWPPPTPRR